MIYYAESFNGNLVVQHSEKLREDLQKNPGARYAIERITPESKKQRGFYPGGVLALWAYLNGYDHTASAILDWLYNEAKKEFNGAMVVLDGKPTKRGKSTKGELNKGYLERVIDFLEEQYAIDRMKVLDPKQYKYWRDTIFPHGGPDSYIDYLVEIGRLPEVNPHATL